MDNQSSISSSLDAMFPNTEGTMPTVTKMHFIEMLKEHVGLSRAEANEVVDSIFDEMQQALSEGSRNQARELRDVQHPRQAGSSRSQPSYGARLTRSALGAW